MGPWAVLKLHLGGASQSVSTVNNHGDCKSPKDRVVFLSNGHEHGCQPRCRDLQVLGANSPPSTFSDIAWSCSTRSLGYF